MMRCLNFTFILSLLFYFSSSAQDIIIQSALVSPPTLDVFLQSNISFEIDEKKYVYILEDAELNIQQENYFLIKKESPYLPLLFNIYNPEDLHTHSVEYASKNYIFGAINTYSSLKSNLLKALQFTASVKDQSRDDLKRYYNNEDSAQLLKKGFVDVSRFFRLLYNHIRYIDPLLLHDLDYINFDKCPHNSCMRCDNGMTKPGNVCLKNLGTINYALLVDGEPMTPSHLKKFGQNFHYQLSTYAEALSKLPNSYFAFGKLYPSEDEAEKLNSAIMERSQSSIDSHIIPSLGTVNLVKNLSQSLKEPYHIIIQSNAERIDLIFEHLQKLNTENNLLISKNLKKQ